MSKENPIGVRLDSFSKVTGWSSARLRSALQRDQLPFRATAEEGARRFYTGADAFAIASADLIEQEIGCSPAWAADRVLSSNCVNEFLYKRESGAPLDDLWLISTKVKDRRYTESGSYLDAMLPENFVTDSKLALKYMDKYRPATLSLLNLRRAYDLAVERAVEAGFRVEGWDLTESETQK